MSRWLTVRTFCAFFFVLFGIGIMFWSNDARLAMGAALASLGLTFFWRLWVAMRTGK
jgi:hypothetical protein